MTLEERFWSKVDKSGGPDACWPWLGSINNRGYGRLTNGSRSWVFAHRLAWEMAHGPIPTGLFVCHRCDNRICANGRHLFLGTNAENTADMVSKGRNAVGAKNGKSKITSEQVLAIREAFTVERASKESLARRFGVSAKLIFDVVNRNTWKHVPPQAGKEEGK